MFEEKFLTALLECLNGLLLQCSSSCCRLWTAGGPSQLVGCLEKGSNALADVVASTSWRQWLQPHSSIHFLLIILIIFGLTVLCVLPFPLISAARPSSNPLFIKFALIYPLLSSSRNVLASCLSDRIQPPHKDQLITRRGLLVCLNCSLSGTKHTSNGQCSRPFCYPFQWIFHS